MNDSGIYVHLPYCRSRCGYCAFVVSTDDSSSGPYFQALDREVALLAAEAAGARFDSLYLGGGTPSLIPPANLARLIGGMKESFAISRDAEVTLEANPEDVTDDAANSWAGSEVTRVSVGVQSFDDSELAAVGRRHDSARAARALEILGASGFSVSGDLILGLPGQTVASFRESLSRLCASGVGHVSVYLLEAEKSKSIQEDRTLRPERYLSDDAQADAWLEMSETLAAKGFRHYEISNWALPGREARHNVKYWKRIPTLGLGVSSHELWNGRRRANVSAIGRYIEELGAGRRPLAEDHPVTAGDESRERIVLGLRLAEGIPATEIERRLLESPDPALSEDYRCWKEQGLLEEIEGSVRLTERGFLLSNEILCRFV